MAPQSSYSGKPLTPLKTAHRRKQSSRRLASPITTGKARFPGWEGKYMQEIGKRAIKSKIYKKYQLIGLEIAKTLGDEDHISLYIKLAKQRDGEILLRQAKEVAERKNIKNRGAYFMSVIHSSGKKTKYQKKR